MGALVALLPQLLALLSIPAVQAALPLLQQLLTVLGKAHFPNVAPDKAHLAAATVIDVESIKWVQAGLNLLGDNLPIDGTYSDPLKQAVRKFQEQHGLTADGWAGPLTADVLRKFVAMKP